MKQLTTPLAVGILSLAGLLTLSPAARAQKDAHPASSPAPPAAEPSAESESPAPPAIPPCGRWDLFVTPSFSQQAGEAHVTLHLRNISSRACTLNVNLVPWGFIPKQLPDGKPVQFLWPADRWSPFTLNKGASATLAYHWKTIPPNAAQPASPSCLHPTALFSPVLIVAPALLPPVCSDVQIDSYRSASPPNTAELEPIKLTPSASPLYRGEDFDLHAEITGSSTRAADQTSSSAPSDLYLLTRSPDGTTRFDAVTPSPAYSGSPSIVALNAGASTRWNGLGKVQFQLFQLRSSASSGSQTAFLKSNLLDVEVLDQSKIERHLNFGSNGLAADITLDKSTWSPGEAVPLHLAIENVSAAAGVRGWDPQWDPNEAVSLTLLDPQGNAVPGSAKFFGKFPGRDLGPKKVFPKGVLIPIERSLNPGPAALAPGAYTIVLTWSPFIGPVTQPSPVEARATIQIGNGPASK